MAAASEETATRAAEENYFLVTAKSRARTTDRNRFPSPNDVAVPTVSQLQLASRFFILSYEPALPIDILLSLSP